MNRPIQITIPKPCHEDWRTFTPTAQGGFCQACQKEVINFTKWTDQAIADYFENAKGKTCGRFQKHQLNAARPQKKSSQWPIAALFTLVAVGISKPAEAKDPKPKQSIEQHETYGAAQSKPDTLIEKIIITGTVRDQDGTVLPGVNIIQKGSNNGVVSDGDGKFMLVINRPKYAETLVFSFIGMVTQEHEIVATRADKSMEVVLVYDIQMLGEITGFVGGAVFVKRFSPRWLWWRVRSIFSKRY